jgi:hypothetical protein
LEVPATRKCDQPSGPPNGLPPDDPFVTDADPLVNEALDNR